MKRKTCLLAAFLVALAFAAACLLPAAALGAAKVKLNKKITVKDGVATIKWKVTGDAPAFYYVQYQMIEYGDAEQGRFTAGMAVGDSFKTDKLIPGHKYTVFLTDSTGNTLAKRNYSIPKAKTFKDGNMKHTSVKISTEYRKKTGFDSYQKLKKLKASEIKKALKEGNSVFGLMYTMKMPTLKKERIYRVVLAFEAPNGFMCVDKAGEITFEKVNHGYQVVSVKLTGDVFFRQLYDTTGKIPKGKYQVTLYWDGQWVDTHEFSVK